MDRQAIRSYERRRTLTVAGTVPRGSAREEYGQSWRDPRENVRWDARSDAREDARLSSPAFLYAPGAAQPEGIYLADAFLPLARGEPLEPARRARGRRRSIAG
jgi:hypothetical protein